MSHIEELPENFEAALKMAEQKALSSSAPPKSSSSAPSDPTTTPAPTAPLPPQLATTADELLEELNRSPLFMTSLDETDGAGGENMALEALKALAYEGTKAEVAGNFREQGNECARVKRWKDAREFYGKALAVLKGKVAPAGGEGKGKEKLDNGEGPAEVDWLEGAEQVVDLEVEAEKEKKIEEACYVNRALCNLELKNYGSTARDCAAAITMNPNNIKALYRLSVALFSVDKLQTAHNACTRLLNLDPTNTAATTLLSKVKARAASLEALERDRQARAQRKIDEAAALRDALRDRGIVVKKSMGAPVDAQDAVIALDDPVDKDSELRIPVLLLYPTHAQSDLVKGVSEKESLGQHLEYILPPGPWDAEGEFATAEKVECYMETASGGLAKIGRKIKLGKVLAGGKIEVQDGLCRVYVVPKDKVDGWIIEFKRRKGA